MSRGFGALVASAVVGTVVWAFTQRAKEEAEVQQVVLVKQPTQSNTKAALFGAIFDGLIGAVGSSSQSSTVTTVSAPAQSQPRSSTGLGGLLGLIGGIEAPKGYNQVYGGSKLSTPKPLTQMTVSEVQAWQNQSVRAGSASSAAGRYQIIRGTLGGLVSDGILDPNERFDEAAQDRAAVALMERRGLSQYQNGQITERQFAQNLSQEWASLPVAIRDKKGRPAKGQSYYAGDGLNKSLTTLDSVLKAVRSI